MKKLSVVFCATPEISNNCLEYLIANDDIDLKLVVSMPDRPAGRGKELRSPAIISLAKEKGIATFQSENLNKDDSFLNWCENNEVDLFIVFAFAGDSTMTNDLPIQPYLNNVQLVRLLRDTQQNLPGFFYQRCAYIRPR